jgi:IPT/TIG domain-containing protein
MKQISLLTAFLFWLVCLGDGATILPAQAGQTLIELSSRSSTPGATLVLNGKGFGTFKSTRFNRVTVNGVSALVQRWDTDVIEIKVPFKATSGFVEVLIGKKKRLAGFLAIVAPRIEAITPTEGERGTTLQIVGHHFGLSAGARDPNTMFGVNDVMVGGVVVRPKRWKDDKIELEIPPNAVSGDVVVRLASSDPLPDGSCCAPVEHVVSNAVPVKLIPSVRVDPTSGPVGTKVVLFGEGFGHAKEMMDDAVLIGGRPVTIAQWKDDIIVFHVPLDAESGPLVLKHQGRERVLAQFTVHVPRVISMSPASAPIGTLLRINGEHFGFYSESGSTPYNFTDFNTGGNRVEIGGVPAVIYRWNDDRIDVWVPFSAKTGKVVIYRSADTPNIAGLCCAERGTQTTEAGDFTLVTPVIESYEPQSAGLDDTVTIKGRGFGTFLKTAEHADLGLNQKSYKRRGGLEINESGDQATVVSNVSRTEVLFNGTAAVVQSWTDGEIVVRVPHRNLYGIGRKGEFFDNLATGPLVVRRGSWDLLPDGTCCSPKKWITLEAGPFTIEAKGLPDASYWDDHTPDVSTNQ